MLKFFIEFLKIGTFSIGAYTSIPLIQESILSHGWIDKTMFANILAISESTPGSILVNAATYVGSVKCGVLGSIIATLGVVLPAFVIILLICKYLRGWLESKPVQAVLSGIKPCAIGIILATGVDILLPSLVADKAPNITGFLVLALLLAFMFIYHKRTKKILSPIGLIIASAVLGIFLY